MRHSGKGKVFASVVLASLLGFGLRANAADAKTHVSSASGPGLKSAAALVVDAGSGEVLFERDAGLVSPIASITKLMTALVVLDGQQPLDEQIEITQADLWTGKGAFSRLAVGTK